MRFFAPVQAGDVWKDAQDAIRKRVAGLKKAEQEQQKKAATRHYTFAELAQFIEQQRWGKEVDSRDDKAKAEAAFHETKWSRVEVGNLFRIAAATEQTARDLRGIQRSMDKLTKQLGKVLKLFETVLTPVAAKVREREQLDREAEESLNGVHDQT